MARIPKIPGLRGWKKVKTGSGFRDGYVYRIRVGGVPRLEYFIFPFPNKVSEGPIEWYYVTDGMQTVAKNCRTKTDCVKAARKHVREYIRSGNPLTAHEQGQVRVRAAQAAHRARGAAAPSEGARHVGRAQAYAETAEDFGPRSNPLTREEQVTVDSWRRGAAFDAEQRGARGDDLGRAQAHGQMQAFDLVSSRMGTGTAEHREFLERMHEEDPMRLSEFEGRPNYPHDHVVDAPRTINPLTQRESEQILDTADLNRAEASRRYAAGDRSGSDHALGFADGQRSVVTQYGPTGAAAKRMAKKRKKRRVNPVAERKSKAEYKHHSIRPQHQFSRFRYVPPTHTDPEDLRKALKKIKKRSLPKGALVLSGKFKPSVTRGRPKGKRKEYLAWGIKTILIPKKGRRKNPRPAPKQMGATARGHARPKPVPKRKGKKRRPAPRRANHQVCRHTLPLARGSKDKLTVCYPKGIFKNLKAAVVNIQKELRAKFGRLSKAPRITRAEWKFSDKAKTKGRWHFTAKKAAA